MNIAEKIARAKADLDSAYDAGVEKGRGEAPMGAVIEPLEVTSNGTYTAPDGVAYSPVKVNVPDVNGSYDEGYEDGYEKGKAEGAPEDLNDVLTAQEEKLAELSAILDTKMDGYDSGFEDGKKAEYDAFWDAFQDNGNRTVYDYAFYGRGWTKDTFAPKYDMQPTAAPSMFQYSFHSTINLKEGLAKNGVKLDFSKCTNMYYCFNYADIGDLPELDLRSLSAIPLMFYDCKSKVIDKIILKADGSQAFSNPFSVCQELEEVRFEGVIGQKELNFQWSTKLSHDSIVSIVNALSTTTSGLPITLSKTAVDSAFATTTGGTDGSTSAEWTALVATRPNWTISLADA